jgi:hypothetical protein
MKRLLLIVLLALPLRATDTETLERDLNQIARVAAVMVDGDVCQRIVTPRALEHIFHSDPRDQYAAGDNYDVDDLAFIATKKTLMRLAQLVDYPVDVNLWMPLQANPPRIEIVIRNRYEMGQFWEWGQLEQEMPAAMRKVLKTGHVAVATEKPGYVSVLAPVRNSLGDIVGLTETVSRITPDARENVK